MWRSFWYAPSAASRSPVPVDVADSEMASSIASLVPEPMEKCAVCAAVSDQHDIAVVPALASHVIEIEPCRTAQMPGITLQWMTAEIALEQPFAEGYGVFVRAGVEPVRGPGLLPGFDDHRREILG